MNPVPLHLSTVYHYTAQGYVLAAILTTSDFQHASQTYERDLLDMAEHEDAALLRLRPPRPLQAQDRIFTPERGYQLVQQAEPEITPQRNALLRVLNVDGHERRELLYLVALPPKSEPETWLADLSEDQLYDLVVLGLNTPPLDFYGQLEVDLYWQSEHADKERRRLSAELKALTATSIQSPPD